MVTALGFSAAAIAASYSCDGTGCCNYVCEGSSCTTSSSGQSIPKWWLDSKNGWESCADKVCKLVD